MRFGPPVGFARRHDGRNLAYQVVGDGDLDLVFMFGWPTHLGLMWEDPAFADRGTRRLKGVPDEWQLYAVELAER
ncbi:MAG TPA: hypothetical protein VFC13_16995 [Actinomycetes bacterium]|jgi:hypothetical protein|nr:hypothetical protein [Actinomycetes bacterium]